MTSSIFTYQKFIWIILCLIIPTRLVFAAITITEIAWMGTTTSQYEEWIELHNDGTDDLPLTGWKLFKTGGTVLFSPTGTIPAGAYYLICRATASLTSPLAGVCDEQGAFGGSGLNNTNDQLILKDVSGAIKESIDASDGWPAGDTVSKQTMQKSGTEWITAVGTPGAETVSITTDPGPDLNSDPVPDSNPTSTPNPTKDPKEKIEKIEPDPVYKAHMIIPDFATAGVAVPLKALVTADNVLQTKRGRFEWSMGDGGYYKFYKNTPITHTFYYPGTYTVVMQYYSDIFREEPDTIHRKTIIIVPSDIEILGYSSTQGLQLKNNASKDIALDGWIIQSGVQEFVFPKYTTLAKGAVLSLSSKVLGISLSKSSVLLNPSREIVSRYSYKSTETSSEEVFVDEPEPQPITETQPLPKSKTLGDIWNQNKWYVLFGGVALVSILAYLAFHLYAKQDELI